jgi:pyruvoyl-dependent arginine decarboxylase
MKNYFITTGSGQSNLKSNDNETTSYDDAVVNARIGNVNVVLVSSMIPPNVTEINYQPYNWGDIVFSIMARNDSTRGKFISCALLVAEVMFNNKLLGSFVLEYSGRGTQQTAFRSLLNDLVDMCTRRKYGNLLRPFVLYQPNFTSGGYTITPKRFVYNSLRVKKRYGTVISAICFN